jgi:hypothetical protein
VSQTIFVIMIVGVMLVAGFLGGLVNYFLARRDDPEDSSFWKSITLGVAASLLVPLFLNMISSSLLESIRNGASGTADPSKVLIFLGFCLVAAISSTAFIKTLSDRILQEAKEAKKVARKADRKASEAQSDIQPLVEKETEAEPFGDTSSTNAMAVPKPVTDENEKKLLQALANGKWVLRTRTGLAKDTGIAKADVDRMMDDLRKRELVAYKLVVSRLDDKKTKRWYITNTGRQVID